MGARIGEAGVLRRGARVYLRSPRLEDERAFVDAVRRSRSLHRPWSYPVDTPEAYEAYVRRLSDERYAGFLIVRIEDGAIVGQANVSEIVRGHFQSAFLGVNAFLPHAGKGYVTEGTGLVLDHAFRTLGLHRLEANVQPGNESSLRLVRRLGFRREGFSRRYLKIGGRWRDHERWAMLAEWWRDLRCAGRRNC